MKNTENVNYAIKNYLYEMFVKHLENTDLQYMTKRTADHLCD